MLSILHQSFLFWLLFIGADSEDHDNKRTDLITRHDKIILGLEEHNNADDNFTERMIDVLNLAANTHKIFNLSIKEKKKKLVNLAFSTVKLNSQKLVYTLRPPFNAFIKGIETDQWCALVYDYRTQRQEVYVGLVTLY